MARPGDATKGLPVRPHPTPRSEHQVPSFSQSLDERLETTDSRLCVGLDPDPRRLPEGITADAEGIVRFLRSIVDATAPYAAAYKPNIAFYEAMGLEALAGLVEVIEHIRDETEAVVILDVKRGDVGHTAEAYARAAYEQYHADAVTVSPYLGLDSVAPFAADPSKGVFVLARTSNQSAGDLQDLRVEERSGSSTVQTAPLYLAVARRIVEWNTADNLGLVAGATWPGEIGRLREAVGDGIPFLIPGVGAQGGDARQAAQAAADSNGRGFLINSGRGILNASMGPDHAEAAGRAAKALRDEIRTALMAQKA
jgi:orotidine-5'-phosphate decarboxylase